MDDAHQSQKVDVIFLAQNLYRVLVHELNRVYLRSSGPRHQRHLLERVHRGDSAVLNADVRSEHRSKNALPTRISWVVEGKQYFSS